MSPATGSVQSRIVRIPLTNDQREIDSWEQNIAITTQNVKTGRANTSGAQTQDIIKFLIPRDTVMGFKGWVLGRRTSGSGSIGDGYGALFRAGYKNKSGTITGMTGIGPIVYHIEDSDSAGFGTGFSIDSPYITLQVTGDTGYEMAWSAFVRFVAVGK